MPWYEIVLTSTQLSAGELARVREHFQVFYGQGGRPVNLALCAVDAQAEGANLRLVLSPATADLAPAFLQIERARPCPRPRGTMSLLVGDRRFLERFQRRRLFGFGPSPAPVP